MSLLLYKTSISVLSPACPGHFSNYSMGKFAMKNFHSSFFLKNAPSMNLSLLSFLPACPPPVWPQWIKDFIQPLLHLARSHSQHKVSNILERSIILLPSRPQWPGCSSQGWRRCTCWWRWGSWWRGTWAGRQWQPWCCHSCPGTRSRDPLKLHWY